MNFLKLVKKNVNKIIIIIVAVFIITFAYNYMQDKPKEAITENVTDENYDEQAMQIIKTLNELEKINIDPDFFTENLQNTGSSNLVSFQDLIDFSEKDIPLKDVGKPNPFAVTEGTFITNVLDSNNREPITAIPENNVDSNKQENTIPETIAG